jgi:hypothetical protein
LTSEKSVVLTFNIIVKRVSKSVRDGDLTVRPEIVNNARKNTPQSLPDAITDALTLKDGISPARGKNSNAGQKNAIALAARLGKHEVDLSDV